MYRKKSSRVKLYALIGAGLALTAGGAYWLGGGALVAKLEPKALLRARTPATVLGWPAQMDWLAGDGTAGFADGAAAQAHFSDPFGLVADSAGNVYIADAGDNNRIRKIAPNGAVTTLAGSGEGYADGAGAAAQFNTPSGMAIDEAGNLYIADTGNNAIRKLTPEGVVTTLAGGGAAGFRDGPGREAQFNGPVGVAVDAKGRVYVADTYNDRIRVIAPDGQVTTLAGGDRPGDADGAAASARFDTPCGLVVNAQGDVFIADTRNSAIRKLSHDGQVTTLARAPENVDDTLLGRPVGLALTHDGYLYISDTARGRILELAPTGELRGLTGIGIDIAIGDTAPMRLRHPYAVALDKRGGLYVSDASNYVVRHVVPRNGAAARVAAVAHAAGKAFKAAHLPWPLKPQNERHEIVGTMGEVRGAYGGDSRDHFHAGLDVQGAMGTPVLVVEDEKVASPLPNWGFGELNEGLALDTLSYIHMRVGRTQTGAPIDPARFTLLADDKGKVERVRVKRGTRFHVGEPLGTINRMFHVHLDYSPAGGAVNPQSLPLVGYVDNIAPHIDRIELLGADGKRLLAKRKGRLLVPSSAELSIVVDAYDQMDGNAKRRRLGLYAAGYQVLHADGTPVPGFEKPLINLEFNRLPPDRQSVKVAYADSSGITVYGNKETRFLYVVTNIVRDGLAQTGSWWPAGLAPGNYVIRILASDFAGNVAMTGRDLPITIE